MSDERKDAALYISRTSAGRTSDRKTGLGTTPILPVGGDRRLSPNCRSCTRRPPAGESREESEGIGGVTAARSATHHRVLSADISASPPGEALAHTTGSNGLT